MLACLGVVCSVTHTISTLAGSRATSSAVTTITTRRFWFSKERQCEGRPTHSRTLQAAPPDRVLFTRSPAPVSPSNCPFQHTYNPLFSNAFCVRQIDTVLQYSLRTENREQNGIEVPSKPPDLRPPQNAVAHAEPPGTPRGAGKAQKRQSQPRTVGFEFWWPGAESNHRHKDFQSSALPTELPGQSGEL